MSKPKEWGDEIVIKAVCEVFGVRILLWSSTVNEDHFLSQHFPKGKEHSYDGPVLKICHFLEVHYCSLITEDQKKRKKHFYFLLLHIICLYSFQKELNNLMLTRVVDHFAKCGIKEKNYLEWLRLLFSDNSKLTEGEYAAVLKNNNFNLELVLTLLTEIEGDITRHRLSLLKSKMKEKKKGVLSKIKEKIKDK